MRDSSVSAVVQAGSADVQPRKWRAHDDDDDDDDE